MLRNMIFDMGNVLIKYDPAYFVQRAGIMDEQERRLLLDAIFLSSDWPGMDLGAINEADLLALVKNRLPEHLHGVAADMIFRWNEPIEPIPGMADFVRECREAGMGVYLLSNASRRQREYWPQVPGSECFDGCVVSAFEGCVKPDRKIFEILLERFGLKAEECMFVDDIAQNVEGAKAAGLQGYWFSGDVSALRSAVEKQRKA